jgi:predicted nucleotidyltransferase
MDAVKADKSFSIKKSVERAIVDAILGRIRPRQIILFGSRARGDATERSDYDIAIDCETLTPSRLAQIRADMETVPTLREIEVVWLNRTNGAFRRRIIGEGKVLYEEEA